MDRIRTALTAMTAVICMGSFAAAAQADPAGKWRVAFGSRPDNDGALTLRISPEGGAPVDVGRRSRPKAARGQGGEDRA